MVLSVSLLTWPGVLNNTRLNLVVFGYVLALPFAALAWRESRLSTFVTVAVVTVALQVASFGLIAHWFDGTWTH